TGTALKPEVVGGLFVLSQQDRGEGTRPVVEIPRIKSKRDGAFASRIREQSAVAKNVRHTKVRACAVRAFPEQVASKVISLGQFSFLYIRYGGSGCRLDRVGIQCKGPFVAFVNLAKQRLSI